MESETSIETIRMIPNEMLRLIPLFGGDKRHLSLFIRKSEYVITNYRGSIAQDLYVYYAITSRLIDDAAALLSEREDVTSWTELKLLLEKHFGDPRSEECIALQLESLKIKSNESFLDFCNRIQSVRSNLMSKINLLDDDNEKKGKIMICNSKAMEVFMYNLPEEMVRIVRLNAPKTLELALQIVLEEVNFHERYNLRNKSINIANKPHMPNNFNQNSFKFGLQNNNSTPLQFKPTLQQKFGAMPTPNTFGRPQFGGRTFPFNNRNNFFGNNNKQMQQESSPQFGYRPQFNNNNQMQQGFRPQFGYRPQFNNNNNQMQQFGYRPQFNNNNNQMQQFGYRPQFNNNNNMQPQQFGNKPPQNTDVSMRTAPIKPSFNVNELSHIDMNCDNDYYDYSDYDNFYEEQQNNDNEIFYTDPYCEQTIQESPQTSSHMNHLPQNENFHIRVLTEKPEKIELNCDPTLKLPYIYIPEIDAKMMIDTGSTRSFMSPRKAYNFFYDYIRPESFKVVSTHSSSEHNEVIEIPLLPTFRSNDFHKFYLYDVDARYDGLIGNDLLQQLDALIDLKHLILKTKTTSIPIINNNLDYTIILQPRCEQRVKLPTDQFSGEAILNFKELSDGVRMPSAIVNCNNGYASTIIQNTTNRKLELIVTQPLKVIKQNTNADAFPRVKVNALDSDDEGQSMQVNVDENDIKLQGQMAEVIQNIQQLATNQRRHDSSTISVSDQSRTASLSPITISDESIPEYPVRSPSEDSKSHTVHSAAELESTGIPILREAIDSKPNQILVHFWFKNDMNVNILSNAKQKILEVFLPLDNPELVKKIS